MIWLSGCSLQTLVLKRRQTMHKYKIQVVRQDKRWGSAVYTRWPGKASGRRWHLIRYLNEVRRQARGTADAKKCARVFGEWWWGSRSRYGTSKGRACELRSEGSALRLHHSADFGVDSLWNRKPLKVLRETCSKFLPSSWRRQGDFTAPTDPHSGFGWSRKRCFL